MRRTALALMLACAATPLAAQPASTTSADGLDPGTEALAPTERYGVAWGDTPEAVAARYGRPPDADEPAGSLTYLGRSGGQVVYIFNEGGLAVVVDASPAIVHLRDALAEYDRYKAAFIRAYGAPVIEDSPRPATAGSTGPPVTDTVWEPGGDLQAVELTLDYVARPDGTHSPFFYVRTVGPALPLERTAD